VYFACNIPFDSSVSDHQRPCYGVPQIQNATITQTKKYKTTPNTNYCHAEAGEKREREREREKENLGSSLRYGSLLVFFLSFFSFFNCAQQDGKIGFVLWVFFLFLGTFWEDVCILLSRYARAQCNCPRDSDKKS
jgi:hypothetical protein